MKGFAEFKGMLMRTIYDAGNARFLERMHPHPFIDVSPPESKPAVTANASAPPRRRAA